MKSIAGNRQFLGSKVPFLVGAYPNRIAPSHVFNGFLASSYGPGPESEKIARFMRDSGGNPEPPPHLADSTLSDPLKLRLLADSLITVLDPDHRVFRSGGSAFPICLAVVSNDPSDDQFGRQLAALLDARRTDLSKAFARSFDSYADPISALGQVLNNRYQAKGHAVNDDRVDRLLKSGGALSKEYFGSISDLIQMAVSRKYGTLSAQLVATGRAIYLASFLAGLRTPVFLSRKPRAWRELQPLFVFGARPPGDSRSPAARLAIRSYSLVTNEIREALGDLIKNQLEKSSGNVPRGVPKSARPSTLVKLAFPDLKAQVLAHTKVHIKAASELKNISQRISDAVYPIDYVSRAYRTLGRMLGLVGPDRGAGSPRFLLETPVLGSLVESTMGERDLIAFDDWIDRVYERFGLILGVGRELDPYELLKGLDRPGPLSRAIKESQEALRMRLVLAGLAVEYSDGETELINPLLSHDA